VRLARDPADFPGAQGCGARAAYAVHLIEHPMLGFCGPGTGRPASTASIAARRLAPVTGTPLPGRLSSNCPA
jgi:hypothetical protein